MKKFLMAAFAILMAVQSNTAVAQSQFSRGDCNQDRGVNIADAITTLGFLFPSGAPVDLVCEDACDFNDDSSIDIADAVSLLAFVFSGGAEPAAPYNSWEADPTPDSLSCKGAPVDLPNSITGTMTLTNDTTWGLNGLVVVENGGVLNIEEGTTIIGNKSTQGLLVVDRGGVINAIGADDAPVVFTSEDPVGQRSRGDWGGIIILGRAASNLPTGEAIAEGLTGQMWGNPVGTQIEDDNSGVISYVRVEFGGTEISPDNEVNGISLFGVGSATQVDHVQVKYNLDDGVEWFGGSSDLKYAICLGNDDDNFDYSFGWNGRGQYWLCQQRGDAADRGFEVDNNEGNFTDTPFTSPLISNITLIGAPAGPDSDTGLVIRRGAGSQLYNGLVMGFGDAGVDIDDAATTVNHPAGSGSLAIDYFMFADNNEDIETGDDETVASGYAYTTVELVSDQYLNNVFMSAGSSDTLCIAPYVLGDDFATNGAINGTRPDFHPTATAAAEGALDMTTLDAFFDATDYRGAVAPAGADWTQARWISYWQN